MPISKVVVEPSGGMKGDGGKRNWGLVYWKALDALVNVLTFGALKYHANNWQSVSRERYESAIMRHWSSYIQGEKIDPETGQSHLAHIMCSLMFLMWFDDHKTKGE